MARPDTQHPLLPSLLDRLIDDEPDVTSEPLWRHSYTVRLLLESVRRDLEVLLNTRHGRIDLLQDDCELSRSALTYGVLDFSCGELQATDEQERLRASVEQAIRYFEPRLMQVEVTVQGAPDKVERKLHLMIAAILRVEPIVERVAFDTYIDASQGVCEVKPKT